MLALSQAKVFALGRYKLAGFSIDRLMNLLTALDRDVEINPAEASNAKRSSR
jgi:predicted XRE-type DNA-binding protein